MAEARPQFRSIVIDTTDARRSAELYRQLLGWTYLEGFEPPPAGDPDPRGADWLVLLPPDRAFRLAFQQVASLAPSTWPEGPVPQQLHLDLKVTSDDELAASREQALALGATILEDRAEDPEERLVVFADPDGHPFCIFVATD
jgi:catechol 2,3-dioxygenase-like lactoylglutathione lyase family enzyme